MRAKKSGEVESCLRKSRGKQISKKSSKKVWFNGENVRHTFMRHSGERRRVEPTFSPKEWKEMEREMDRYKESEMLVHRDSKRYTNFNYIIDNKGLHQCRMAQLEAYRARNASAAREAKAEMKREESVMRRNASAAREARAEKKQEESAMRRNASAAREAKAEKKQEQPAMRGNASAAWEAIVKKKQEESAKRRSVSAAREARAEKKEEPAMRRNASAAREAKAELKQEVMERQQEDMNDPFWDLGPAPDLSHLDHFFNE